MIRIARKRLAPSAADGLRTYQGQVDASGDYAARVAAAKRLFGQHNKKANAVFKVVRRTLAEMCRGPRRCMYCEDSVADEVEHVRPKDLYPEVVFAWTNYLYACGPCNGPKNNRFLVIDGATSQVVDVTRPRRAAIVPPVHGAPVVIDPIREDPLVFLMLDLRDTFEFTEVAAPNTIDHVRASRTIEILGLNRDFLIEARQNAFSGYRARLAEFVQRRDAGAGETELTAIRTGVLRSPHPTVWAEMKRQRQLIPALANLFQQAPESLTW